MNILAKYTQGNTTILSSDGESHFRTDSGAVRYFSGQGISCEWQHLQNDYGQDAGYCLVKLGVRFKDWVKKSRQLLKIAPFEIKKDVLGKANRAIFYPSSQKDFFEVEKKLKALDVPYSKGVSYIETYLYA